MTGYEGYVRPADDITRAEVSVIINKILASSNKADISSFSDVNSSDWFYDAMAKIVKTGILSGSGNQLMPNKEITRQEAFSLLARIFGITNGGESALEGFADKDEVASWAKGALAAMVEAGYVSGNDGKLNPNDNITRAEFAQVLSNIGCKYVFESGEVSGDFDGNVFIGSNNVTLSGTVKGNVILGDGVDKTVLKDVKVTGDVISRGKDVEFNNAQVDGNLVITGSGKTPEIKTDDNTKLGGVKADKNYSSEKELENVSGNGENVHGKTETPADTKKNTHGSHHGGGSSSSTTAKGTEIDVAGAKYYYSTKAAMTVGGKTVTGEQIGDTGVYLYTTAEDKDVYGVANVPYADFYYAELGNEVTESSDIAKVSKSKDEASSLREEHVYDAVTSATNKKSKKYAATYITEGSGTTVYINGVKTAVKINAKLYAAAKAVAASKVTTANKLAEIADSIETVSSTLPSGYETYKTVNADGTLSALTAAEGAGAVDSASTKATITSTSPWGNYQIDFTDMPSDIDTKTNVLGVVLETEDGQKVALRHNENIYSKKEDIAFVVDDSFTEPHGNVLYGKRFKSLSGKTITKITYLLSNKQSMTLNVNLRCAAQVPAENKVTVKSQTKYVLGQGATVTLDTSKLLFKDTAEVSVKMGRKKVLSSDKYLYDASTGELKINGNGGTGAGEYTVVFHDTKEATTGYADTKVSFTLESDVAYDDTTKSVSNYSSINVASISAQKNVDKEKQAPAAVTDNGIINDNGFVDFSNKAFEGMKAKDSYKVTVTTTEGDSFSFNVTIPEKIYAYATLSYAEYWAGEDVYKPSNMEEASTEADSRGEYDKGAFDAVTRATANHGMHRGSFVQDAYILGENGKEYKVAKWTDANNAVLADGRTLTKNTNRDTKETTLSIGDETTKYVKTELKGIKYVPVAVDAADFHSLCENRSVYGNGSTLAGGFSENNLKAYSETAYVDSTTNGLKEATLNGTTWSFGARQTGSGSGILDEELHTASTITTTPKENVGSYGEKIRVDLTGDDYGALGSQMQTVKWTYYGNDSTYSDPVISYGTKFAADNWMHKMMGIQLGLTDSARFQLPSGYNGIGYWKITVYALGYEDYSTTFELTAANIAGVSEPMSEEQKTQLTALKDEAKALLDKHGEVLDGESDWKALKDHYEEAVALLKKSDATSAEAEELLEELPALIAAVKPQTMEKTGEAVVKETNDHTVIGEYTAKVKVTVDSEGKIVSVTDNGTEPGTYNASYWNKAKNYFSRFKGKTASEIDGIDATSGATVSLNAVKSAVKSALGTTATTLEAPTISAADLRTEPVFAADEDAAFTVTGEEGSTTYTKEGENADASDITNWVKVDESKPVVVAGPSKDAHNINIKDITNENKTPSITEVILNAVSVEGEKKSTITSKKIKFIEIPSDADLSGTKVYEGSAACDGAAGSPYTVKVKVTTINGKISKIEDNGTSPADYTDEIFYGNAMGLGYSDESMSLKLKGKNLRQIINAKTTPYAEDESYAADAVSGATVSSNSVKYAVINALISSPVSESENTVSAPTVSAYESGFVVLNALNKKMNAVITGNEDTTIRYTLDGTEPTAESAEIGKIGYFGDKDGVAFEAEPEKYPDGRIICLKVAAFNSEGQKSDTVTKYFVFANTNSTHSYEVGSYTGKSGSTSVNVTVEDPSYSGKCLITNIQLDDESKKKYSAFADEFLSRIYLKQNTAGVDSVKGHETECAEILAAVKNALDNAYLPSKPTITLSEEKNSYENSDLVGITFATPTEGAEIYYTVDNSNTMSGSTLSDPTKTGTKYEGTFNVNIENKSGGKLYIRAAAKKDGKWSSTSRKDLTFLKGVKENAFVVNGTGYSSWNDAVSAINSLENGGTIVLNDDVELSNESVMPTKPCTIKSADGNAYKVKANILNAQADVVFDGITYDISRVYANGHSVTVKDTITYKKSWLGRKIYAGRTEDCTADNCVITVEKGDLEIYAGNFSGTFNGDVTVNVSGTDEQTKVNLNGTGVSTTTDGNVTFNVDGGNKAVYIGGFLGEVSGGNITGTLTLNITGNPELSSYGTYKASVDKETFGVLDFTGADSEFVSANKDKFTKFAEIKGGASTAADTAEILSLEEAADEEKEVYGPVVLPIYNEETPVAGIEFYFDELNSEETDEFFEETEDKAEIKDNLTEE